MTRPKAPKGGKRSYLGGDLPPEAYYEAKAEAYHNPHAPGVAVLLGALKPHLAWAMAQANTQGPALGKEPPSRPQLASQSWAQVLDLGCGDGLGTKLLASEGWRFVGLDASPAMVARYRAETGFEGLVGGFGVPLPSCAAMVACHALHLASPEEEAMLGWRLAEAGVLRAVVVGPFKDRPQVPAPYFEVLERRTAPVGPRGKTLHAVVWGRVATGAEGL